VDVKNYNENEEATCIEIALLLTKDNFNRVVIVPLLSVLSLFVFPIMMYWSTRMQADWLYKRAQSLQTADCLLVIGRGK
jgi:uncharacterized membrane protein